MTEGKFVVIEGPDGAGSSTQLVLARRYLETERKERVLETKEPTNNLVGGLIRGVLTGVWKIDPYGTQLLFCADRAHHLEREIEPALAGGWYVTTDRYAPSTIVYGSMAIAKDSRYSSNGRDKNHWWERLMEMNKPFRVPDLTMLIDLDPNVCIERIRAGRPSMELFETEELLRAVVEGYRRFAREYPNTVLIDGNGTTEEVHARIKTTMDDKFYQCPF